MNKILKQLEKRYVEAHNEEYNIAIEISFARQGIDPTEVSRQHKDQIRNLNNRIEDIKEKANQKIIKLQHEAQVEMVAVHNELVKLNLEIRKAQGINEPATEIKSAADNPAAP